MRKVTFSDGTEWEVQPLTIGQVRVLRKNQDKDPVEQMFTTVETAGFSLEKYEALPFGDLVALNRAIWDETFGNPEETKN